MPAAFRTTSLCSGELRLAVREHSAAGPGRPSVVLVHGYPDRQDTWGALLDRLPLDRWHVVSYDVRGAGGSGVPDDVAGYRTDRLVDDLVAVLDGVLAPGEPAHLVGHDWGSVQLWEAVAAARTDPRLHGRVASFVSVSGPSLDHVARLLRHSRGRRAPLLRQGLRSWYIGFFRLPVLPDLAWRVGHPLARWVLGRREGLPADHWGPGLRADAAHGLGLYRANTGRRAGRPRRLRTDVPVLVVHPERDRFLSAVLLEDLDRRCTDLRVERIDAGHWATVTHAERLAALVVEHVDAHPGR